MGQRIRATVFDRGDRWRRLARSLFWIHQRGRLQLVRAGLDVRFCCLVLGLCLFAAGFGGCAESSDNGKPMSRAAMSQAILSLPTHATFDSVRSELGEPLSEASPSPKEASLSYPGWLLLFRFNHLDRRIRQRLPSGPRKLRLRGALDQRVLTLQPGMSIPRVKSSLGPPQSYEEVFRGSPQPELVLRYGPWELAFANGHLRQRIKQ